MVNYHFRLNSKSREPGLATIREVSPVFGFNLRLRSIFFQLKCRNEHDPEFSLTVMTLWRSVNKT